MATDPVCRMEVEEDKAVDTTVFRGKTYYFCATVCKEKFERDPERYLEEEEGPGSG